MSVIKESENYLFRSRLNEHNGLFIELLPGQILKSEFPDNFEIANLLREAENCLRGGMASLLMKWRINNDVWDEFDYYNNLLNQVQYKLKPLRSNVENRIKNISIYHDLSNQETNYTQIISRCMTAYEIYNQQIVYSFVQSLDNAKDILDAAATRLENIRHFETVEFQGLRDKIENIFQANFPDLKHIRDSLAHLEDRAQGRAGKGKKQHKIRRMRYTSYESFSIVGLGDKFGSIIMDEKKLIETIHELRPLFENLPWIHRIQPEDFPPLNHVNRIKSFRQV